MILSPQQELLKIEEDRKRVELEATFIELQMNRDIIKSFNRQGHAKIAPEAVNMHKEIIVEPRHEEY